MNIIIVIKKIGVVDNMHPSTQVSAKQWYVLTRECLVRDRYPTLVKLIQKR